MKALLALSGASSSSSNNNNEDSSVKSIADKSENVQIAKFSSQTDLNLVLFANPLVIPTRCDEIDKSYLVECSGWMFKTESNGKEGLITIDPKAVLVYKLNEDQVKSHLKNGIIHIQGLKSYEHMGAICIKLSSEDTLMSEYFIDYLWDQKVSETFVDKFDFSDHLSKFTQSIAPRALTTFEIHISVCSLETTTNSAKVSRIEHKIKLFRISIF